MPEFGTQDFSDPHDMTKEQLEAILAKFYRSYLDWVERGAPRKELYNRTTGLCDALCQWAYAHNMAHQLYEALDDAQREAFIEADLDENYPFNCHSLEHYDEEEDKTQNAARMQWVRERAAPKV